MRRSSIPLVIALVLGANCASEPPVDTSGAGPPTIRPDVVQEHARQFSEDVPVRTPGSQEELAAASYILGHLQQAGYVPLLDAVPVANLVESTNVVARPPRGAEPEALVAVSYGSEGSASGGEQIGLFLELARALNVVDPDHSVAFVALGAEASPRLGSALGTRRLLQYLSEEGLTPHVITVAAGDELAATGARADEIVPGSEEATEGGRDDLFVRAGLAHTTVTGPPVEVGEAILDHLDD